MMSKPQLILKTALRGGQGPVTAHWLSWGCTGYLLSMLAPGKAGSPWQPPARCGGGTQAGGASHTQNENHMLGLAFPQATGPQLPLPLFVPQPLL